MPQLVIPDYAPQIFWLVVTFVILLALMWSFALPRVGRVLEQRQKHIDDDLSEAEKFKQGAEEAIKAYEASLAEARAKAHQLLAETQAKLDQQAAEQRARLDAQGPPTTRKIIGNYRKRTPHRRGRAPRKESRDTMRPG